MAVESQSSSASAALFAQQPMAAFNSWYSSFRIVSARTAILCIMFFFLGRMTKREPAAHRDQIIAEVLWSTALARSHISAFLPTDLNTTTINAVLRSAIRADHMAFTESVRDDDVNVNDAFFSYQIGQGVGGTNDVTSLQHRNLTEFMLISRAVATVAGRLLMRLGAQSTGKTCAVERRLQAWATVHVGGSAHDMHVHEGAAIASVYYVTVPPDGGVLRLHDPRGPRPPFDGTVEIRPREGEIVAFPAWLVHEVTPGGDGERISVAFNVPGSWDGTVDFPVEKVGLGRSGDEEKEWTLDWGGAL